MADRCGYVLVVEDGQPFVEEQVKAILSSDYEVKGRLTETLPRTGELTPDNVGEAIGWGINVRLASSGGDAASACIVSGMWSSGCV